MSYRCLTSFFRLSIHVLAAKIQADKVVRWCQNGDFLMVALCNRADHYIFALWFLSFFLSSFFLLSFFFSSPNLSGRRLDVYHTSTHGVALVRI